MKQTLNLPQKNVIQYYTESANESSNQPVIVFPGRFQPFHSGHYSIYKGLIDRFGPERVFIATSDITGESSPFGFDEKQKIISTIFGIDPKKIVNVKNPYRPEEILKNFPDETSFITAVSEKDAKRLSGSKYYKPLNKSKSSSTGGYKDVGYYYVMPLGGSSLSSQKISGTEFRNILGSPSIDMQTKKDAFQKVYGKWNPSIFHYMTKKITQNKNHHSELRNKKKTEKERKAKAKVNLQKRIINPLTKNKIMVKTALSYPEDHPAKILAMKMLNEGGAAGHMAHPYEDLDMTFGDMKSLIKKATIGQLDNASEKLDGQNIMVTVRDGKVLFARNKGHLKNRGEHSLDSDQLRHKFHGRGPLEASFGDAASDLASVISKIDKKKIDGLFGNGQKFFSVEIITPETENAIPYDKNIIVFHGSFDVSDDGEISNLNSDNGKILGDIVDNMKLSGQRFDLRGPMFVSLSDSHGKEDLKFFNGVIQKLNKIQQKRKLSDDNTLYDLYNSAWDKFKPKNVDEKIWQSMKQRLITGRGIKLQDLSPEIISSFKKLENKSKEINSKIIEPIKLEILKVGAKAIHRSKGLLAADNPELARKLQTATKNIIHKIKTAPDEKKTDSLMKNLELLNALGLKAISASEGLVFSHKGNIYKLTGTFAPLNQLMGTVKYQWDDVNTKQKTKSDEKEKQNFQVQDLSGRIINPLTKNKILIKTALRYPKDHPAYKAALQMTKRK